jgi:hypothetical protein
LLDRYLGQARAALGAEADAAWAWTIHWIALRIRP